MSILIVIPARYASSRFPGKPLELLKGATGVSKSLIERTWNTALQIEDIDRVVVATDDQRIKEASEAFGAEVVMTSSEARNGTERCAEVLTQLSESFDYVVNLQGDAPLTPPWFVSDLLDGLQNSPDAGVATPVLKCSPSMLEDLREDRRAGRVGATTAVVSSEMQGLYFSKEVLPFGADGLDVPAFHHVGVYAYRPNALESYAKMPESLLEQTEGLEQLRFLDAGLKVLCVEVDPKGRQFWELNNPQDVPKIESMMAQMNIA
ncbi:MAG: manno-octulosonate cytidylyltransferase [Pseudomonadota bacterium]